MKTIELKNGQIIEEYETMKEITNMIIDNYINNKDFLTDDDSLYVEYKDGTYYLINAYWEEGMFKKGNYKKVIECNAATFAVYGEYRLIKTDDTDTDINCCWIAE